MLKSTNLWRYAYRSANMKNVTVTTRYCSEKVKPANEPITDVPSKSSKAQGDVKDPIQLELQIPIQPQPPIPPPPPPLKPPTISTSKEEVNVDDKKVSSASDEKKTENVMKSSADVHCSAINDKKIDDQTKKRIIEQCTLLDEQKIYCQTKTLNEELEEKKIEKPNKKLSEVDWNPFDEKKYNQKSKTSGEEHWNTFVKKYQEGNASFDDVTLLLKAVYKEAQYQRYEEAPRPALTAAAVTIAPLCSLGLLSILSASFIPALAHAQLAYGAVLLAFFGGVNWSQAFEKNQITIEKLSWAVVPPVLAWMATMLPFTVGFILASVGFTASLTHDVLLTRYPQWFKALRYVFTMCAIGSFVPTLISAILF